MSGVQYMVDAGGRKTAVVIDLLKNGDMREDFYDRYVAEKRADEPRVSLQSVKTHPKRLRKLHA